MRGRWGALVIGAVVATVLSGGPAGSTGAPSPSDKAGKAGQARVAPLPADAATGSAQQVTLADVACPSKRRCVAVGSYTRASGQVAPLVEVRRGRAWTAGTLPFPDADGAPAQLSRVECPTANFCVATGAVGEQPLLYTSDGSVWDRAKLTLPPGGWSGSSVHDISCPSATACVAVGSAYKGDTEIELGLTWDGAIWTTVQLPRPSGATRMDMRVIDCPSVDWCLAGGDRWIHHKTTPPQTSQPPDQGAAALVYDGGAWSVAPGGAGPTHTFLSKFDGLEYLSDIDCVAAKRCFAVGPSTHAYRIDGAVGGFRPASTKLPLSGGLGELFCQSPTSCVIQGSYRYDYYDLAGPPYVARVNGDTITEKKLRLRGASASPRAMLEDSVCRSIKRCLGVGWYEIVRNASEGMVTQTASGRGRQIAAPADATYVSLSAVARRSFGRAVAVGTYQDADGRVLGLLASGLKI